MKTMVIGAVFWASLGCTETEQEKSAEEARERAEGRRAYVQKNELEFRNYNQRQLLADDPTAILWCTSGFPIPASPLFTVPIVGKLTSGSKRPFPKDGRPGPDGMYGSSGEYRYGFTPSNVYADWYSMPVFCTTEPMIWQRESTTIVMDIDKELLTAQRQAQAALKQGDQAGASKILAEAIQQIKVPLKPDAKAEKGQP